MHILRAYPTPLLQPPGCVLGRHCSSESTEHMVSRACQCVPKQSADAAGACAGKFCKKIICVILMQQTENWSFSPSLSLFTDPENIVHADEGGQAVLNCLEPWHRLLKGKPEYHYSWAPSVPGTKTVFLTLLDHKLWHQYTHAEHFSATI